MVFLIFIELLLGVLANYFTFKVKILNFGFCNNVLSNIHLFVGVLAHIDHHEITYMSCYSNFAKQRITPKTYLSIILSFYHFSSFFIVALGVFVVLEAWYFKLTLKESCNCAVHYNLQFIEYWCN